VLVPASYNLRSLFVRRSSTLLTILGIGATVAILAGVLSLQQGFASLFQQSGSEDLVVFLRPGTNSEGESLIRREAAQAIFAFDEIAMDEQEQPLASKECYVAVRRFRIGGGETNVPVRGVEPASFKLYGDAVRIVDGEPFHPGTDEVIVGRKLVDRIENCRLGDVIQLNTSPLKVVGIFESDSPFASEIWGDLDRMLAALQRPMPNRVVAKLKNGVDVDAFAKRIESDKNAPATVLTERTYYAQQTGPLSAALFFLGFVLALVMGTAAVFTATNTMLAAVASRTHEIGILLATGFRPVPIFLSFLFESLVLGLLGGLVGCLLALPLNGMETGATNFATFTEVAFAFRVTPPVLATAVVFAVLLGLLGGAVPAWRAARMAPIDALRRR
jgi:ABC-type lipoprotein release transport system permease subunit